MIHQFLKALIKPFGRGWPLEFPPMPDLNPIVYKRVQDDGLAGDWRRVGDDMRKVIGD